MSERFPQPGSNGGHPRNGHPAPPPPAPAEDGFGELRELLVGPEQAALKQLQDPERRLEEIAAALPEAIARRGPDDRLLIASLRPLAQETMAQLVKQRPQYFADLFSPIIAPTIRRSIAQAFENTMEAIRRLTEQTFTIQGLKWRIEAWRSGLSVTEVAMRHTLLYRVDQVFLIHRETGVLLQYVSVPDAPGADSDMVSGMLTAISQFVSDSFKVEGHQGIDGVNVGEFKVWVEHGPKAYLAITIRGTPPAELRELLQDTLDGIHTLQGTQLEEFSGDASEFNVCRPELEACLRSESSVPVTKKQSNVVPKLVVAIICCALLGWWFWREVQARAERVKRQALITRIEAEPGLVPTFIDVVSTPIRIRGLKDPLAVDPAQLVREGGYGPGAVELRWEPYLSLDPAFILRRAQRELSPPAGITLQFDNGTLRVIGNAPNAWTGSLRRNARAVPGILRVDDSKLIDTDLTGWRILARDVESLSVRFSGEDETLTPDQREELARVARVAINAAAASAAFGRGTQIEVTGELFRASAVASALSATPGVPPAVTRTAPPRGGGQDTVSFRLLLTDATAAEAR